jgi:bifunctional DNA primase/polymerase-like protein
MNFNGRGLGTSNQSSSVGASSSMLDVALRYALTLDVPVFPCNPEDKRPWTEHGHKDASRDDARIRTWWAQWPNAMIGVPCGPVSGVWVLDVDIDPSKGVDGFPLLRELIARHGELPPTLTSVTPRGGHHLIFKWTTDLTLRNRTGVPGPGIDVRAAGGYFIAPPSMRTDGAVYRWDTNTGNEPAEAPAWLIALVSPQKASTSRSKSARKNTKHDLIWAQTALEEECKLIAAAPYGKRNDQLNASSYNVFQIVWGNPGLLNETDVRNALLMAAEECGLVGDDGLDACERTIASAAEPARAQPRTRPQQVPAGLNLNTASVTQGASTAGQGTTQGTTQGATSASAQTGAAAAPVPDPRRVIQLQEGDWPFALDEAEDELVKQNGFGIYQRGGQLVRAVLVRMAASDNRSTLVWQLAPVALPHIIEVFGRIIQFQVYNRRSKAWVPKNCPGQLAEMYEARRWWKVSPLLGIVHTPQLRTDGSLTLAEGYDPGTRLIFKPDGESFPTIPGSPTRDDALAALELINDAIGTFPFKTAADRAVALSLLLTAVCRRTLDHAPLHGITSPVAGSGKSLLVDLASILQCSQSAPVVSPGRDEGELEKRLGAMLMSASAIVSFDNCAASLGGVLLSQALTQQRLSVRLLGYSRQIEVPTSALFTATGNNLTIEGDLVRRSLRCELDAGMERPELREFSVDAKTLFRRRRGELVMALLTILRAHQLVAPRPPRSPLGGFEMWSTWVRDALLWLDCDDPCSTMETIRANDPEREAHEAVTLAWLDCIPWNNEMRIQGLIDQANKMDLLGTHQHAALREALFLVAEDPRRTGFLSSDRLGRWLRKVDGRIVGKLRIVKTRVLHGYPLYRLQSS